MQISFVMLIFLMFSDQTFFGGRRQKSPRGANCLRGRSPMMKVRLDLKNILQVSLKAILQITRSAKISYLWLSEDSINP